MPRQTHINGVISETRFLMECLRMGWEIAKPVSDIYHYDFVLRLPGFDWQTVQVKTALWAKHGTGGKGLYVNVRHRVNNKVLCYEDGDFDLMGVVHEDRVWLLPWEVIKGVRHNLGLRGFDVFLLRDGFSLKDVDAMTAAMRQVKATHPNAKLTSEIVAEIRRLHAAGATQHALSKQFNLAQSHVGRIVRNEAWHHK